MKRLNKNFRSIVKTVEAMDESSVCICSDVCGPNWELLVGATSRLSERITWSL